MTLSFREALAARGIDHATVKRRAYYHANKHKRPETPRMVYLIGGPWSGQRVPLTTGGTLPVSCQGYRGAYDANGTWCPSETLPPARRVTDPASQYNLVRG